jgi:hypothetical protein
MNLSLPPKLVGKLVWVPFILIPNYVFDALLPVFFFIFFIFALWHRWQTQMNAIKKIQSFFITITLPLADKVEFQSLEGGDNA